MGANFSADEAKIRLMEWCCRGAHLEDVRGVKKATLHMDDEPKRYDPASLRSEAELCRVADTIAW